MLVRSNHSIKPQPDTLCSYFPFHMPTLCPRKTGVSEPFLTAALLVYRVLYSITNAMHRRHLQPSREG